MKRPTKRKKFLPDITHQEALRQHALKRLFQRFGIAISNGEYAALCADVQLRLETPAGKTAAGNHYYEVVIRKRVLYAGWHSRYGVIATFHEGSYTKSVWKVA